MKQTKSDSLQIFSTSILNLIQLNWLEKENLHDFTLKFEELHFNFFPTSFKKAFCEQKCLGAKRKKMTFKRKVFLEAQLEEICVSSPTPLLLIKMKKKSKNNNNNKWSDFFPNKWECAEKSNDDDSGAEHE